MSISEMFRKSSQNLSKIQVLCVCSMMLGVRIVLGMFTNFTLSFAPFVKIGFSFLPTVIIAYLYGPVCSAIVSGLGDILSIVLSNPTSFSIMPGITICYILEGLILGIAMYGHTPSVRRIVAAFICVLLLCRLPLNTLVLHTMMGIPYFELLLYRTAILVPFAAVEVTLSYYVIKTIDKMPMINKIK